MNLDKASILSVADTSKVVSVEIPEWNGTVHVRVMTGPERDSWEIECMKDKNIRARLAFICLSDEQGNRMFTTNEEFKSLCKKSASALDKIFDAAASLNALSDRDRRILEKNSE